MIINGATPNLKACAKRPGRPVLPPAAKRKPNKLMNPRKYIIRRPDKLEIKPTSRILGCPRPLLALFSNIYPAIKDARIKPII